jgi:S1-C subfamily serine protease
MRNGSLIRSGRPFGRVRVLLVAALTAVTISAAASAQGQPPAPSIDELLSGVVQIKTFINPDGRSVSNLGRERAGSGIVLDSGGLVLTIGYLMLEAHAAEIVTNDGRTLPANVLGYDHESGFGLLRAIQPPKVRPLQLGKSAEVKAGDRVLVASFGGAAMVAPVVIAAKREFAGSWEYLLDEAIFTAPPHPAWSGAALINREGRVVGVGSLIMADVSEGAGMPGNMFVPIDRLPPILADLIAEKPVPAKPRPWLGVNTQEIGGRLLVSRVTPDSPAEKAGIRRGDVIVGVDGEPASSLADLYRKIWAKGTAGVTVGIDVVNGDAKRRVDIKSMDRRDHLRLKSTY